VDEFQAYARKGKQQALYYLLDMLQVGSSNCLSKRELSNGIIRGR
jgi:hypothetical protein